MEFGGNYDDGKIPGKILRGTGVFHLLTEKSVLPFCFCTATGDCILVQRMGLDVLPVPAHKLEVLFGVDHVCAIRSARQGLGLCGQSGASKSALKNL